MLTTGNASVEIQPVLLMPSNLSSTSLNSIQSSLQSTDERGPTFEEMLQHLHSQGIYIHSDQLAEFLLAHGLPVHLRYVPGHLRHKALRVNQNYQGDLVRLIEEPEPPCWDFSWMKEIQKPLVHNDDNSARLIEEQEQPSWDYSWLK
ncbi:MAG TPA: hypothetical protein V6D37_09670 [Candidatus Sericytochromatia bacterium]|jgi:hypothetical protein